MTARLLTAAAALVLLAGAAHALPPSASPLSLFDEDASIEAAGCGGYHYRCATDFRTGKRYCYKACYGGPRLMIP